LKVELVVSDQYGDMIEDRLDLAIRVGEITDASVIGRRIGIAARVVVASPTYIEREGQPSTPSELAGHACIVHDIGPDSDIWTFAGPEIPQDVRVSGGLLANDGGAVHLAARAGYGIAFLPLIQVVDDLRRGELIRVLSNYPSPGMPFSLVYPSRRHLAPRTRAVMEFIVQQVREVRAALSASAGEEVV
jgi:DNA-binding transcriptional LysR family regulator